MDPRIWMGHLQSYLKQAKQLNSESDVTADARFKLGKWAYDNGLEDEARPLAGWTG